MLECAGNKLLFVGALYVLIAPLLVFNALTVIMLIYYLFFVRSVMKLSEENK